LSSGVRCWRSRGKKTSNEGKTKPSCKDAALRTTKNTKEYKQDRTISVH
jgi:hypothetical protein